VKKATRRDTRRGGQEQKENNLDHQREVRTPEKGVASAGRKEMITAVGEANIRRRAQKQ